jgi:hypothetical protein
MIRDVATHWNSTAEMIQRALHLAPALKILVIKAEHNKPGCGVRLARFKLSPDEWQLLANLSPLLDVGGQHRVLEYTTDLFCKVFLYATTKISKQKIPLIHQVILYFDSITTALKDNMDKAALPLVVCHAALRGYLMLNKYYTMTDASVIYRVAMSTFPLP